MRGKGRGERAVRNRGKVRFKPNIVPVEQTSHCYRLLVERQEIRHNLANLDALQFELEKLLVSIRKRGDSFKDQLEILTTGRLKKRLPKKPVAPKKKAVGRNAKRGRSCATESRTRKNCKKGSRKPAAARRPPAVRRPRGGNQRRAQGANNRNSIIVEEDEDDVEVNKFWEFVKSFHIEVTEEHIKFLNEWSKTKQKSEFKKPLPRKKPLKSRRTKKIAKKKKKKGVSGSKAKRKTKNSKSPASKSVSHKKNTKRIKKKKKKKRGIIRKKFCPFGPLTRRVVSCFLLGMKTAKKPMKETSNIGPLILPNQPKVNLIKSLNLGNPVELEKRIKENLKFIGLLKEPSAAEKEKRANLLKRYKMVKQSLATLSSENLELKQKLLQKVKEEVAQQQFHKKLDVVNVDVLKFFRRSDKVKEKRLSLSNEKQKQALCLINTRKRLSNQANPKQSI